MQQQQYGSQATGGAGYHASAGQFSAQYAQRSSVAPPGTDNSATATRRKIESGSACEPDFCKSTKRRCGGERPCKNCTERAIPCQTTNSRGRSSNDLLPYPSHTSTRDNLVYPASRSVSLASSSYATLGAPAIPAPGVSGSIITSSTTSSAYPTVYYPYPASHGPNSGYWQTYNKLPYIASSAQGAPLPGSTSSATAQPGARPYGANRSWVTTIDTRKPPAEPKSKFAPGSTRASHFQLDAEVVEQAKILARTVPSGQSTSNNGSILPSQPVFRMNEHGKMHFFGAVSTSSVLADLAARQSGALLGSTSRFEASSGWSKLGDLLSCEDLQLPEEATTERLIESFFEVLWPIFPVVERTTVTEMYRALRKSSIADADAEDVTILLAILACATVVREPWNGTDSARHSNSPEIPLRDQSTRKRRRVDDAQVRASSSGEGADGKKLYDQCRTIVMQSGASSIRQAAVYGLLAFHKASIGQAAEAWQLCGSAMRIAIDLGLHRSSATFPLNEWEERRRVFWSLYSLEVTLSANLGRPMSLFDEDIDQEYPRDRKGDVSQTDKPISLDGFVHLLKLHRLTSYIIRLNALPLRPESVTPKTPEQIQARQLEAESRLQKWFGEQPSSLKGDFEALSKSERIYKHIITGMYPSAYMLIFLPSLPKEGIPPSDFQIYSLSRVILASKDLCMMAPAFTALVPASFYSFDLVQHLLVASSLLALLHRKSSTSGKGGDQPLQMMEGCVEALQACGEVSVGEQRQVVEEAVAHLRTITGSEALRAMSEAPPTTTITEASPAPATATAPLAPASTRASAPAAKKRAPKGSNNSRRASPKKLASTRKPPAKARAAVKQSATLPEITNNDDDSSLTSLSSCGGPMEDERAPAVAATTAAVAVTPSGMVTAAHDSPDVSMQAEASSVESTLDMVKEAIATAPPSAEVSSTDMLLSGTAEVSISTTATVEEGGGEEEEEEEEEQQEELVEPETAEPSEYFVAPAPPFRTSSAALQSWHASTTTDGHTSATPEVSFSYYTAHQHPSNANEAAMQPYSTINYPAATVRRQSIAPHFSNMAAFAQPGESSDTPQMSYSYNGYLQNGYTQHGYSPAVAGSSGAAGGSCSVSTAIVDDQADHYQQQGLMAEGQMDLSATSPAAWSEYEPPTKGNYAVARSASTIRPADMQISSAPHPHNTATTYSSATTGYYGSYPSYGDSAVYQAPSHW